MQRCPARCPGCGCNIYSGILWCPNSAAQQARLCCNVRCAKRAQRHYKALLSGRPRRLTKAVDCSPICVEAGWGSLSADVLRAVGPHLGLADRMMAALTCKHWYSQLTSNVGHLDIEVCFEDPDISCAQLESARAMMPQVESLGVRVAHHSMWCKSLLRSLHVVTKWTQLKQLSIAWAEGGEESTNPRYETLMDEMCMGAIGRLTALESLSIDACVGSYRENFGLYTLSSLSALTALTLLNRLDSQLNLGWGVADTQVELPGLRTLHAHACMLPPPVLASMASLTTLVLHQFPLSDYGMVARNSEATEDVQYDASSLASALECMQNLRVLRLRAADRVHDARQAARNLQVIAAALASLSQRQKDAAAARALSPPASAPAAAAATALVATRKTTRRRRGPAPTVSRAAPAASDIPSSPVEVCFELAPTVNHPVVAVNDELTATLAGVSGLRRLDLFCADYAGVRRLAELTGLTYLAMRSPADSSHPTLSSLDFQCLVGSRSLQTLVLHLPADVLEPCALTALALAPALRVLELSAHPYVKHTAVGRWDVRAQVLQLAGRHWAGYSAARSAEVGRAALRLMSLQQAMLAVDLDEVKQALASEAEWRQRQGAQAQQAQHAQQQQDEGDGPHGAADEGLVAMPAVPTWALASPEEEGIDTCAATAAAFWMGPMCPQVDGSSEAECIPLHKLTLEQLARLRKMLVREELVVGPRFELDHWVPRNLVELQLRGFAGLSGGALLPRSLKKLHLAVLTADALAEFEPVVELGVQAPWLDSFVVELAQ